MHWVLAVVGAWLGFVLADADETVLGLVAGALLGWQGTRLAQLRRRVATLEARSTSTMPASAPATAAPPRAAPAAVATTPVDPPAAPVGTAVAPAAAAAAPRPTLPPRPARPRGPSLDEKLLRLLRRWFMEGNVPAKIGALVIFVAVAGLLKLALDQGWVTLPIELRLSGIALAAIAALAWGWRSRGARPVFAMTLQGLGIGVLLLTVFGAYRLYALLPAGLAFALVLVLVAAAALLAVLQHAPWLALVGFIGGYLAPVLVSTGSGNHVALFGYYALLNAAVLGIAWVRPWRALNLVGFGFTFVIGALWGYRYYQPQHFASTEPFLLLFFAFYVALPVLYARRQAPPKRGLVDGTLVFGTPLLAFPLQAALLAGAPMPLAFSALGAAAVYALLAAWLLPRRSALLGQSFAALSIGFATLAVPLALSARWTSAAWALEGAALVWVGLRQRQRLPQLAGWVLQALALAAWVGELPRDGWDAVAGELPLLNGHALGVLLMALSAFFIAWCHERAGGRRWQVWPPFLLGLAWWQVAGVREIAEHADAIDSRHALVGWLALTAALAGLLRGALRWPRLGWIVAYAALLSLPLALATVEGSAQSVFRLPAAAWWLGLLAALLFALSRLRVPLQRGISLAHLAVLWTLALALGASLYREAAAELVLGAGWRAAAAVLPLALLAWASWAQPRWAAWPLAAEFPHYRWRWWGPALLVLALAWVRGLAMAGGAAPLPWIPLLNPLELLQLAGLLVALRMALAPATPAVLRRGLRASLPFAALAFVSMAGLRSVHHYSAAPWSPMILDHAAAQTTLTVLWSIAGVVAWIVGSRRRVFPVWLAGAMLMGLVLAKLVLVDRQYMGNLTGIVSFLAVGLLLVLVGRIAPTPPRSAAA